MGKVVLRLGLLLAGLVVGLIVAELAMRLFFPSDLTSGGHTMNFAAGTLDSFQPDPECGYLPKTNYGEYDRYGCIRNEYKLAKPAGKKRILFVGDSVTHRARLVNALRKLYGEADYEYWNAGVESFNTVQELALYRRYNAQIKPDQVILSFHNNDFMQTPLVYRKAGKLKIMAPQRDFRRINMWWFENSYFYRFLIGMQWRGDDDQKIAEVSATLRSFQELLAEQKVDFRVILLPLMKPLEDWDEGEKWSREESLKMFQALKLHYFDLWPRLEKFLASGARAAEAEGDFWHPNDAAAADLAQELKEKGLLLLGD